MYVYGNSKNYGEITSKDGTIKGVYNKVLHEAHTLIAGATGSGKSVFMNGLIYSILLSHPEDARMILCDPKRGAEFGAYKELPHTAIYADTVEDIKHALEEAHVEMERRLDDMGKRGMKETDAGHIYIFVDELADLLLSEYKHEFTRLLQSLAQLGRAAHIHCILATQCPSRQILIAPIVVNMTCRVALHCETAIESKQIMNRDGAELLPRYGKCFLKVPGNVYEGVDVPMYSEEQINELVNYYLDQRKQEPERKPLFAGLFNRKARNA